MELHADAEIEAPVSCVWEVLIDFAAFREWNPFLTITGRPEVGTRIKLSYRPECVGGRFTNMRATMLGVEVDRHLRWAGFMWVPSWFEIDHSYRMQAIGTNRSYFIQRIAFTGSLVPFVMPMLESGLRQGLKDMTQALKERVEARNRVTFRAPPR